LLYIAAVQASCRAQKRAIAVIHHVYRGSRSRAVYWKLSTSRDGIDAMYLQIRHKVFGTTRQRARSGRSSTKNAAAAVCTPHMRLPSSPRPTGLRQQSSIARRRCDGPTGGSPRGMRHLRVLRQQRPRHDSPKAIQQRQLGPLGVPVGHQRRYLGKRCTRLEQPHCSDSLSIQKFDPTHGLAARAWSCNTSRPSVKHNAPRGVGGDPSGNILFHDLPAVTWERSVGLMPHCFECPCGCGRYISPALKRLDTPEFSSAEVFTRTDAVQLLAAPR